MKKVIINRKDLRNNLKILQDKLKKESLEQYPEIIAVVKGNGMGLGLVEYSKFLINNGINILAVANVEEAEILRENGVKSKILMLTPISNNKELSRLIKNNIILTVSSIEQIDKIKQISQNEEIMVHLKIDTGFGRYGFLYTDKEEIMKAYTNTDNVKIIGIYTHFARPLDMKYTTEQFDRFLDVVKYLKSHGINPGIMHCSESTAMLKYPLMNLNAVRIGSAIQGRTLIKVDGLKQIGTLKSSIQEIKTVPKGYNISYGDMYKTKRETRIAIAPVGYMDGLNMRKDRDIFSFKENIKSVGIEIKKFFKDNSIKVTINDKKYNVIGRVGMYHVVIDITDAENISFDDEVIFELPPMQVNNAIRREYI